jgi:DNA-directed RNA polymerase specialized sigma24 family protein
MMYQNGCGVEETGTTSEQEAMRQSLMQMICRMTTDAALRDDLMQEALVHLWLTEARRPGQTRSWYLQSCKFHIQHYLSSGRSIDSAKRRDAQYLPAPDLETEENFPEQSDAGNSVVTAVSARELVSLLADHLQPQEKAVLACLADGLGPREIGRELKISHTMVIRHRRKIACLLTRLESVNRPRGLGRALGYGRRANGNGTVRNLSQAKAA